MSAPVTFHPEFFVALVELGFSWERAYEMGVFTKLEDALDNLVGACLRAADGRPNSCGTHNLSRVKAAGWDTSDAVSEVILPAEYTLDKISVR